MGAAENCWLIAKDYSEIRMINKKPLASKQLVQKKLADMIKGSEVHIIENCGHMMLLEEADQTLEILKRFILEKDPI